MKRQFLFGCCLATVVVWIFGSQPADAGTGPTGCYQITTGEGAGVNIRVEDGFVNDTDRGIVGSLVPAGPHCPCLHFHGTLFGVTESKEQANGCGWGCVSEITCPEVVSAAMATLILNVPDLFLRAKLTEIRSIMDNAVGMACWSVAKRAADAFLEEAHSGLLRDQKTAPQFGDVQRNVRDYLQVAGGLSITIANDATTHVPAAPSTNDCSVLLYIREGSGSNSVLRAVGKQILVELPASVHLEAEGLPPGGTYVWSASNTNNVTASGNTATYTPSVAESVKIQVTYNCPDGKVATAKTKISAGNLGQKAK